MGKTCAPHKICKIYIEQSQQWTQEIRRSIKFDLSMIWQKPQNHFDDYHFCLVSIIEVKRNNRSKWTYPELVSARGRVLHLEQVLIPTFNQLLELFEDGYRQSDHFFIIMKVTVILR